jgi:PAS domain S-box-containing protein
MDSINSSSKPLHDQVDLLWYKMISEIEDYAIILLDNDGIVLNWNKGAEKIKGYSAKDIVGQNFSIFYPAEDQARGLPEALISKAMRDGNAVHEGWRVRKNGTHFWAAIVITAIHDEEGNTIGFSKVTRDLTERKRLEDLLKSKNNELEKMNQELSSFAYIASHDLQEPLRKIQAFASRISETEKDNFSEKSIDYFARMQSAAERMQNLINDLLTYSRTSTMERKFEEVDLNNLIEDVKSELDEAIQDKKAMIEVTALPKLHGIRFQFQQLFTNLLMNSLKFSKSEVPSVITITSDTKTSVHHKALNQNTDYHHIIIRDNGIGFEPEYNLKIFEVFQRLHGRSEYNGTGIGLAICKKIVENHKGFIEAEGEVDTGATFHIYIPVNLQ